MKNIRTIILAAGKGTRMKSSVPKVLHKVCGKPIIQYVLDIVSAIGSLKNYVVLGHKLEKVSSVLGPDIKVVEQKRLLGTADAIVQVATSMRGYSGDVLVLCGDTPLLTVKTVKDIIRKHKKTDAVCTFLTAVVHDSQGYGRIIRDASSSAIAIREDKDADGYEKNIAEINVGVYCFKAKHLFKGLKSIKLNKKKKEFYLTDIIENFVNEGLRVETVETDDFSEGLGVNNQEDLATAEGIIRKRILRSFMQQGVNIVDPNTTYIDSNVKIGKDVVIKPFSFIEDNVKIGDSCIIGPFARIRQGTKIGKRVEIGNFAEVSRSKIGDKCFVKHFSFIGDATVGSMSNIGAGTITANFDGKDKHKTIISERAFIGSDSVLIAPVKIGKGAVVGAGSVVTKGKNVPDGGVAFGSPAKIISRRKKK